MPRERFAVIGDPVEHSLSPAMHNAALRAAGIDAGYGALRLAPHELGAGVERLRRRGYRGFNVTVPHKEAMFDYVDRVARSAAEVAAINTVICNGGVLEGHNTDSSGFVAALELHGLDVQGAKAVVFGAGGAARGVVHALLQLGSQVTVVNRTVEKARKLARDLGPASPVLGPAPVVVLAADDPAVTPAIQRTQLLVNATTLGMSHLASAGPSAGDAGSPLPPGVDLLPRTVVVDLIYGRQTPFLQHAAACGCRSIDGLEMLVQQGAESFRFWTGVEPDVDVMREACLRELAEVRTCSAS